MTFDKLVQKRMLLLIILLLMINMYFGGIQTGYNRTLGWSYDLSFWVFIITPILWLAFLIGYGILAILKYFTNKNLSILHLILIMLVFFSEDTLNSDSRLTLIVISIIVFVMNFIWAIRNRKLKILSPK